MLTEQLLLLLWIKVLCLREWQQQAGGSTRKQLEVEAEMVELAAGLPPIFTQPLLSNLICSSGRVFAPLCWQHAGAGNEG